MQLNKKKLVHVRLGFGLHFGRAVKGAIGSDRKLDVTYISSNVELAEWLEGSTKTYGVNLLMTREFHHLLSIDIKGLCRIVDKIKIRMLATDNDEEDPKLEHIAPTKIYTLDLDIQGLKDYRNRVLNNSISQDESDGFGGGGGGKLTSEYLEELKVYSKSIWKKDKDLRVMRGKVDTEFLTTFGGAFQSFFKGEWDNAYAVFDKLVDECDDGVSNHFLNIIEKWRKKRGAGAGQCPRDFHGFCIEGHDW